MNRVSIDEWNPKKTYAIKIMILDVIYKYERQIGVKRFYKYYITAAVILGYFYTRSNFLNVL